MFEFRETARDGHARTGRFTTPHGEVTTPVFMPVGTKATVKTQSPRDLRELGVEILLGNTYHLFLKPGADVIRAHGGLHAFMRWGGPILTDSGGFQVFSLADSVTIDEEGVTFASPLDGGASHRFTPESVVEYQALLGSDIAMVLDHVVEAKLPRTTLADAMERTHRWAERAVRAHVPHNGRQALFPIVQGGAYPDLRLASLRSLRDLPAKGIAIGGLAMPAKNSEGGALGESKDETLDVLDALAPEFPADRPRYLMGVGTPEDLVEGVYRGIDMFDCVLPTRIARTGAAFTPDGRVSMKLAKWRTDTKPLMEDCACPMCRDFSTSYVRHLVMENEILGMTLLTQHNLHFLLELMRTMRTRIEAGTFGAFREEFLKRYRPMKSAG